MKNKKAHQILKDFIPVVVDDLDEEDYFDLEESDKKSRSRLWKILGLGIGGALSKKLFDKAMVKNREVLPIINENVMVPGVIKGASRTAMEYGLPLDASRIDLLTRQYFEEHSLEFVRSLSETDVRRLRGYVWMERGKTPGEFAAAMKDRYVFDGGGARFETIFRTETHRAVQGGSNGLANESGATWKRRIGRYVDIWPRPTHQEDIDLGWIPIDEAYPNTGEMFSGESEINCYCHDEYGFGEEPPEDQFPGA